MTTQPAQNRIRLSAQERRESILDAALRVFVERSYRGATTAEIASMAECNESLIFRHFGSKTGLFVETINLATKLICEEATAGAGGKRGFAGLERLARHKARHPDERYQDLARVRFIAATEASDPEIADALQRHLDSLHEWTANRLQEAADDGELGEHLDPDLAAWQWSSAMTMTSLRVCAGDPRAYRQFEHLARSLISSWRAEG